MLKVQPKILYLCKWSETCFHIKQECIPVGCVPPTHWLCFIVCYACPPPPGQPRMPPSNHTHTPHNHAPNPPSNHTCRPATMHSPATTHATPQQPCIPSQPCTPQQPHTPPSLQPHTPSNHTCTPLNRMTNRSKNITLPQTSFAGSKYQKLGPLWYIFTDDQTYTAETLIAWKQQFSPL